MAFDAGIDLFGSESSDSSSRTNTDNSQAYSSSQQLGGDLLQLGPNVSVQGSGSISNLTLSDYGAIAGAQDLLQSGLSDIVNVASKNSTTAFEAVKQALGLAAKTSATGAQTWADTIVSIVKWVGLALAAAWVAKSIFKVFKKKG